MHWYRIRTIALHSWYHLTHSRETFVDLFYGPIVQIFVFGFIATYFAQAGTSQATIIILGFVFWTIVTIAQYSISLGMLWEVWSKSFSTLFITPLTMKEFILGHIVGSIFKCTVVFLFLAVAANFFYHFSVFSLGGWLLIYITEMMMFGWAIGMFVNGLIIRFGTNIQSLAWGVLMLFQPLGATLFPVDILPYWLQRIAWCIPLTYIFEAARSHLFQQLLRLDLLFWGFVANLIYLSFGVWFLSRMYHWARETGEFARMEQ